MTSKQFFYSSISSSMIRISQLPLITSQEQFEAAGMILLVDVILVGNAPRAMREYIKEKQGGFVYNKETYMPITLTGEPKSLLANAEKGIHFKFDRGFENLYTLSGNLDHIIACRKLYDMSAYLGQKQIAFEREVDFIVERYLATPMPAEPAHHHHTHLISTPPATSIGTKSMTGLKLVKK